MRVKYLTKDEAIRYGINLHKYPNFSATGSVRGMKEKHYGKDALLVRSGAWIYNVDYKVYNLAH